MTDLVARLAAMTAAQRSAFLAAIDDPADLDVVEAAIAEAAAVAATQADAATLARREREARSQWERAYVRWLQQARPDQVAPPGDWLVWFLCGGRGSGKTLSGAHDMSEYARRVEGARIALVAPTFADGRDTMVEGETGLLSVLPPSALRGGERTTAWNRSMGELFLANGSRCKVFSSEEPGRLRGPQHHRAWVEEPASFKDAHLSPVPTNPGEDRTWANLEFGCRLGAHPQIVVTGTPKRVALVKYLLESALVTRATTYDNLGNLSPAYRRIISRYEGTRLGRQELSAELLEDVEGALWRSEWIERDRTSTMPECSRVVVAVDPSGTRKGAEAGVVVVALGLRDEHGYVLADRSLRGSPHDWATAVIRAYREFKADRIVGEVNFGAEMVEATLRAVDASIPFSPVNASRGKVARAEPIAALYERRLVHHVGVMTELEDQMTSWVPGPNVPSPDRMDALVWGLTALGVGQESLRPARAAVGKSHSITGDLLDVAL